ncbi:hypothetical protein PC128_g27602 [Phytophthora cactorum]|nr:hypothetical protein PC120_g22995 [Phytophthora cactorum]KAG3044833.1 hypothetical protein PC121_g21663 [Phytophthora cactorum]KAG3123647.1 hypothetical protein PC128_g27602 [Phytophthora cactorum]KAG4040987.1 hypothetical protein PC123_g23481 [Phytophthora cactorum]
MADAKKKKGKRGLRAKTAGGERSSKGGAIQDETLSKDRWVKALNLGRARVRSSG